MEISPTSISIISMLKNSFLIIGSDLLNLVECDTFKEFQSLQFIIHAKKNSLLTIRSELINLVWMGFTLKILLTSMYYLCWRKSFLKIWFELIIFVGRRLTLEFLSTSIYNIHAEKIVSWQIMIWWIWLIVMRLKNFNYFHLLSILKK